MIIFGPNLNVAVVPYCRDNHLRSMMKEKKTLKFQIIESNRMRNETENSLTISNDNVHHRRTNNHSSLDLKEE